MAQKPERFSVRKAIAAHFGLDVAEIEDWRYQPGRTPCAVYSPTDQGFFTASKSARKPREVSDNYMGHWRWREIPALGYAAGMGWHIWESISVEDDESEG